MVRFNRYQYPVSRGNHCGMFTGLIENMGVVDRCEPSAAGVRLMIRPGAWPAGAGSLPVRLGDSIAVNGCCLTLAAAVGADGLLAFDVIPETLAKTTIGGLKPGAAVNLELSATLATVLGGHLVQGHVDGVGVFEHVTTPGDAKGQSGEGWGEWRVRIRPPAELMQYIVPKGSVAIDGVSLTIASVNANEREGTSPGAGASPGVSSGAGRPETFDIALIPTTLAKTTLGTSLTGHRCNIECDSMAKTVVHYLKHFVDSRA
jgi:riboflavin synthase